MQSNWSSKRDWLLFRNKVAGWQEAYIGRLNKEYIELLRGDDSEADKFWKLCKRIREDRRCAGVQISMRGSDPLPIICRMINEGVITLVDLRFRVADLRTLAEQRGQRFFQLCYSAHGNSSNHFSDAAFSGQGGYAPQ